jgi:PD-(D/E)XK nuclease superfamily
MYMQMNQGVNIVGANDFPGLVVDAVSVHSHMLRMFSDIYTRYGTRYSENLYQKAIIRRAYLDMLPIMTERELFVDFGEGSLLVGRVDLEVTGNCLYELKITAPNIAKDSEQILKYLRAYDQNKETIQIASLVYFTNSGVVVHEVRNSTEPQEMVQPREHDESLVDVAV